MNKHEERKKRMLATFQNSREWIVASHGPAASSIKGGGKKKISPCPPVARLF